MNNRFLMKGSNMLTSHLFSSTKKIIEKHHPDVIAITGSVGKTTTKHAIAIALEGSFSVRASEKNYNNEIGVPLSVVGEKAPGKSPISWIRLLGKEFILAHSSGSFPEKLVLEYGIDKPGDMDYLTSMVHPHISVVQQIGEMPVHVEFFKDRNDLVAEKAKIVTCLTKNDIAILNADDPDVARMAKKTKATVTTFGFTSGVDFRAADIRRMNGATHGLSFKLEYAGKSLPVQVPHIIAEHHIYPILAAYAVAAQYGLNMLEVGEKWKQFRAPNGRMNLLEGIKETMIIDDTYNSSPKACMEALEVLGEIPATGRKIAALGDMAELGTYTEEAHRRVGQKAANIVQLLVVVGLKAKFIADEARKNGLKPDQVHEFVDSKEAGAFLDDQLKQGDLVLVKGSQSVRMEHVTKELMRDPLKATDLLVRQEESWQK